MRGIGEARTLGRSLFWAATLFARHTGRVTHQSPPVFGMPLMSASTAS